MASKMDVANSLVAMISQLLYPDGVGQPGVVTTDVAVYVGWPIPDQLDADIAAGKIHVSIFPRPEERKVPRQPSDWVELDDSHAIKAVRWQEQLFQITVWAPTPDLRESVIGAVDPKLADISRIDLPDASVGLLSYQNSHTLDGIEKSSIYREDLFYNVEYPSTLTEQYYPVTEVDVGVEVNKIINTITVT